MDNPTAMDATPPALTGPAPSPPPHRREKSESKENCRLQINKNTKTQIAKIYTRNYKYILLKNR